MGDYSEEVLKFIDNEVTDDSTAATDTVGLSNDVIFNNLVVTSIILIMMLAIFFVLYRLCVFVRRYRRERALAVPSSTLASRDSKKKF